MMNFSNKISMYVFNIANKNRSVFKSLKLVSETDDELLLNLNPLWRALRTNKML